MSQKYTKQPRCAPGPCLMETKTSATTGRAYTTCQVCHNFAECDHVGATLTPTVAKSGKSYMACSLCGGGVFEKKGVSAPFKAPAPVPVPTVTRVEFENLKREFFTMRTELEQLKTKNGSGPGFGRQTSAGADNSSQYVGEDGLSESCGSPGPAAKRSRPGF